MFRVTRYPMISKTESGRVRYRKKYRVSGRVRVPAGHWSRYLRWFLCLDKYGRKICFQLLSNPMMVVFHVKLNYCFEDHSICMEQALPPLNNQSFCFVFISAEWKITQVKRESNMKSPFCVGAEFPNGQQHSIFRPRVRAIIHCISAHVLLMACWTC